MKKGWIAAIAAVAAVAFAAGCGGSSSSSGGISSNGTPLIDKTAVMKEMATSVGPTEGQLNLICWAGYCEDGSTDPTQDWVHPFEKQTGCKVNVKVAGTSNEMVSLMQGGGYDAVSASGDASVRLIAGNSVVPVNTDLVPNYADISPFVKDQPYNTVDGVHFGIPHGFGANLLMWNTKVVTPAPDSWSAVFDNPNKYAGKVTAYDSPIYIADAAVYLKATQPSLGITNPYELTKPQFDAAVNLLTAQRPNVGSYWSDYTKEIASFESGDSVVGTTWQVIANLINPKKVSVKTVLPKEGSTGWSDTWMLAKGAAHPNCAYKWFNYITSPSVQASVAQWFGEAPANPKACTIAAKGFCDTFHAQDPAYYDKVYWWSTPTQNCRDNRGNTCIPYSDWIQAWTTIKG